MGSDLTASNSWWMVERRIWKFVELPTVLDTNANTNGAILSNAFDPPSCNPKCGWQMTEFLKNTKACGTYFN